MRILHTSDWHVGKKLGRYDRMDEHAAVLAEVGDIADREAVDLVVVSGDVFDRPSPPVPALRLAFQAMVRLTADGSRPVVAVAGNHDSPDYFDAVAPFLVGANIHLVGNVKPPDDGGILDLATPAGRALVAGFPFLREGRVVELMREPGSWYGQYAERVRHICAAYADGLLERAGSGDVTVLAAHFVVTGARIAGHGRPRGERELHMGEAYAAGEDALPPSLTYVAMGHVHAPQPVPGANVPAEYAGSLLQLDFGEAGEDKRVVIVEADPPAPAVIRSIPLHAGRRLTIARGTWDELAERTDLEADYLDLVVDTTGPDPSLGDRAVDRFDHVVKVRAEYDREDDRPPTRAGRPLDELYGAYHEHAHGTPLDEPLLAAFREVWEEVEQ
jgi:exonuclease SbcD